MGWNRELHETTMQHLLRVLHPLCAEVGLFAGDDLLDLFAGYRVGKFLRLRRLHVRHVARLDAFNLRAAQMHRAERVIVPTLQRLERFFKRVQRFPRDDAAVFDDAHQGVKRGVIEIELLLPNRFEFQYTATRFYLIEESGHRIQLVHNGAQFRVTGTDARVEQVIDSP